MSDIFISYTKEDADRAVALEKELEDLGWSVWWDHEIPTGQVYDEVIEAELMSAKCVIVLWTRNSVSSKWVKEEAQVGADRGLLFPVLLDQVDIPMGFRRYQAATLVDWDGSSDHPAFKMLVKSIRNLIATGEQKAETEKIAEPGALGQESQEISSESDKEQEVELERKVKEEESLRKIKEEEELLKEQEAETQRIALEQAKLEEAASGKEEELQRQQEEMDALKRNQEVKEEELLKAQKEQQRLEDELRKAKDEQKEFKKPKKKKTGWVFFVVLLLAAAGSYILWPEDIERMVTEAQASIFKAESSRQEPESTGPSEEELQKQKEQEASKKAEEDRLAREVEINNVLQDSRNPSVPIREKIALLENFNIQGHPQESVEQLTERVNELENILTHYASIDTEDNFVTCRSVSSRQPVSIMSEFSTASDITIWASINSKRNETVIFEWLDSQQGIMFSKSVKISQSTRYRIWDKRRYPEPGDFEVRIRNSQNETIANRKFSVR